MAARLGLRRPEELTAFFRDLGLGSLRHQIGGDRLRLALAGESAAPGSGLSPGPCEFERGLIDGTLEIITGMPVTTAETTCRRHGDHECSFEAVLQADPRPPRFLPATGAGLLPLPDGNTVGARTGGPPDMRSWYLELAGREVARARRHNRLLALLYIDLDDLGEINQAYGRKAGDQVLGAVAAALGKSCRCEDFIWHHREDEFAVLLAETDSAGARIVASRLAVKILSAAEFVDVSPRISASIGVASFPRHSETVNGLLNSAKSALYMAKAGGKGLVHEADALPANASANPDSGVSGIAQGQSGRDFQPETAAEPRRAAGDALAVGAAGSIADGSGLETAASRRTSDRRQVQPGHDGLPRRQGGGGSAFGSLEVSDEGTAPAATVLFASVSPMLIAGMKQVISSESAAKAEAMTMMREVTDSQKLSDAVMDARPDIVFTDLQMATAADFALPRMLNEENLPSKIVVFANDVNPDVLKLAADYSVDGVILQQTPTDEALEALKSIYRGKQYLPDEVQAAMIQLEDSRRLLSDLSERELEVLRLVAEGKSNSQISEELYITVNTVRFHLANVYQKLGVGNRTEAAKYYLRQDLAPNGQTKLL